MVEIFNGTGVDVNLKTYTVKTYGSNNALNNPWGNHPLPDRILPHGKTFLLSRALNIGQPTQADKDYLTNYPDAYKLLLPNGGGLPSAATGYNHFIRFCSCCKQNLIYFICFSLHKFRQYIQMQNV
jgi:hypothetical protein